MAYDALQEATPQRAVKEYLNILKLAAEEGETAVDEALRGLLDGNAEAAITAASITEVLRRLETILPVTVVEVLTVDLTSFDQFCRGMAVRQ